MILNTNYKSNIYWNTFNANTYNRNKYTQITTAFVQQEIGLFAPLDTPIFTGTPTAPTPLTGTNNQEIATTAFVQSFTGGTKNITKLGIINDYHVNGGMSSKPN